MTIRQLEIGAKFKSDYSGDSVDVAIEASDRYGHTIAIAVTPEPIDPEIPAARDEIIELSAADFDRIVDEVEAFRRAKAAANGEPCKKEDAA